MTEQETKCHPETHIHCDMSVAYVEIGGNTGHGKYQYHFKPGLMLVPGDQRNVTMCYRFDDAVGFNFKIRNLISSDSQNQISNIKYDRDGRWVSFRNANDRSTLIFFMVVVEDLQRHETFSCDPEVGNDPQITP
ncbi:hypothetical protein ACI6Q5_05840 [Xanthomonas codiaei]|uniref:Uncharacterized protein n=1 Tax=Xanthomonas codiaei TaxID=56463 RepID=A0A2S7CN38_9XANT|nr:hypothetical protein [Xanthomonas codiaei]MCC8537463.1 hypothetical protein [Xanthomonas codiaei]PPU62993.1 hypothetical protein XcodCFBP4690_13225 [Xanthomonas codiaei]